MARDLITPVQLKTMGSTTKAQELTWVDISTANGAYIKTTGGDASKLLLFIQRTTGTTAQGTVTFISGSTATTDVISYTDNFLSNFTQLVDSATAIAPTAAHVEVIILNNSARYKDSDDYLKINFSTALAAENVSAAYLP